MNDDSRLGLSDDPPKTKWECTECDIRRPKACTAFCESEPTLCSARPPDRQGDTSPKWRPKVFKCESMFADELRLIRDRDAREFVVGVFETICPDTFWTQPASTTGKYHPRVSVGEGGLARHTKLAVWWGVELAKALEMEDLNDETVTTLLLHDVLKRDDNVGTHGLEMAHAVREHVRRLCNEGDSCDGCLNRDNFVNRVVDGIAYHMGRWTQGGTESVPEEHGDFCQLVHLTDYCASRKVDEKLKELLK